jgi:hypothetical protein
VKITILAGALIATLTSGIVAAQYNPSSSTAPDSSLNFNLVKIYSWNEFSDVALQGDYAYCSYGGGMMILDVSDSTRPAYVSELDFPHDWAQAIAVSGDYAYLCRGGDLHIIDVSDPFNPSVESTIGLPSPNYAIEVIDTLAYVTGLEIVNIADPQSPYLMGSLYGYINPFDVVVDDTIAYMVTGDSELMRGAVLIIGIADPNNPYLISVLETEDELWSIALLDNYAYILPAYGSTMIIVDITDPQAPYEAASYPITGTDIEIQGLLAYVAGGDVRVLSLYYPLSPELINVTETPGSPWELALTNGLVYVADGYAGLQVYDKGDPDNLVRIGGYVPPVAANDIVVEGEFAYIAGVGLKVLDVVPYYKVNLVGNCDVSDTLFHIALSDTFAYLTSDSDLYIIDIADPRNPYELGTWHSFTHLNDVAASGGKAIVTGHDSDLIILNVSDPQAPFVESVYEYWPLHGAYGVGISGDLAYYLGGGLTIVNISNPQTPYQEGNAFLGGWPWSLDMMGNYAYVGSADVELMTGYLMTVNIENPQSPYSEGRVQTYYEPISLATDGNYAFVGEYERVEAFYISDPQNPQPAGYYSNHGMYSGIAVSGGFVHAVDSYKYLMFSFDAPVCGDANNDESVDIGDAVFIIQYIFMGGTPPEPICQADPNDDDMVNIGDAVYLINYIFRDGPPPVENCCQ